jgi:Amt family ammonium transporter
MSENQNVTTTVPWLYDINPEDTNWIITSAFMIFTMQTGEKKHKFIFGVT